jgi:hypothetical protein
LTPGSPISFQSSFSITVDIANTSGQQFNGDVAAALLDNNNNFVNFIETKTAQSYDVGFYYTRTFTSATNPSTVPGNYQVVLYQKETNAANWSLIGDGSFVNNIPLVVQMVNSDGLELYASIVPNTSPISLGAPFSVSTNFYNNSSADFDGEFSIDIHDMQGGWLAAIDIKSRSLGAGNVFINTIDFSSSGLTTLSPGTYQLAAWMRPSGGNWELVGNGNYANPVQVDVAAAALLADIYENNNTTSNAHPFNPIFSGTQAVLSTPGSNIHIGGDYDYYRVNLAAGYSYFVYADVLDSYNTSTGQYDNDVLFSYNVGNGFSETFDNASHTIIQPNGGSIIFKVASYYVGQLGSYELRVRSDRGTVALDKISESAALSAFPIPADDLLNLVLEEALSSWDQVEVYDLQGKLMYQLLGSTYASSSIDIVTKDWTEGLYLVLIRQGADYFRKKVLVSH